MKTTIVAVLLLAFLLSSCTKEMEFHLPKKYTTALKNKIVINLYYNRYTYSMVETFKGQTYGYKWDATTNFDAPLTPDDGIYTVYDIPQEESPAIGQMKIAMHRNAPHRDPSKAGTADSLDLIGDGYWTLQSSSGSYSYLTKAAGKVVYYQVTPDPEETPEDYPSTQYDLTGLSN